MRAECGCGCGCGVWVCSCGVVGAEGWGIWEGGINLHFLGAFRRVTSQKYSKAGYVLHGQAEGWLVVTLHFYFGFRIHDSHEKETNVHFSQSGQTSVLSLHVAQNVLQFIGVLVSGQGYGLLV